MKRIAMTWDYPEVNLFAGSSGSWQSALDYVTAVIEREAGCRGASNRDAGKRHESDDGWLRTMPASMR